MTMLIICVIAMINTFIVNTINVSLWNHHKIPNKFSGVGMGKGAQPLPILPPPHSEEGHISPHLAPQFSRHWRLVPVMSSATMHSYRAGLSALLILL